jgi:adenylosuccinate synthase
MNTRKKLGKAVFVVGLQHGDEGKGKIVDLLAKDAVAVVRGNGGSNAGHTIVLENGKVAALHQLPSGIAYPDKINVLAHGVLVDPVRLVGEMADVRSKGIKLTPDNLVISDMAHLVLPKHKELDAAREAGGKAQGSTKAGIAFAASDKSLREGLRVSAIRTKSRQELVDIAYEGLRNIGTARKFLILKHPLLQRKAMRLAEEFADAAIKLKPFIQDTPAALNDLLGKGRDVLVEGAQAFGLDINHGKYPYSTSTGTTVPALIDGTGINPKCTGKVVGVAKATPSKVGGGSFVTRIDDETVAESTRGRKGDVDGEYGATTGRQREVGYLDLVLLKRAVLINGVDEIALTKFDCIQRHGKKTKIATAYERHIPGKKKPETLLVPPSNDEELALCRPVYKEFPTWEDDNSREAERYLKFIEKYLETPVSIVSNGPQRNQIFLR